MTTLKLENITKKFEEITAVKNLNLEIKDREFLVILGPSGCGKTMTLRIIAGLELPTEGRTYMNDEDITHVHPKNRKMAMVFQSYALYPHMTSFDNIAFPLIMQRRPKEEIKKRINEVAKLLKIGNLLKRKPKELSGGEKQRVALGRAVIKEPKVFLMDEPLSNIDAKLRVHLRGELKKLQRDLKITTIYVTHDQIEAMTMADRIAVLDRGELLQVSPPYELYDNPATSFVAGFIGSPATNLIDCSLTEKDERTFLDAEDLTIDVSHLIEILNTTATSPELILGIRPEDISILQGNTKGKGDFTASIHTIEPLGLEAIASIKIGDKLIHIRVARDFMGSMGEEVGISLDKQRMYIFDAKTGKRCV